MAKQGVTYDGAEPPPPRRNFEPYPHLVGWSGPVLTALCGYRGPYVPRKPVLFGRVVKLLPKPTRLQLAEDIDGPGVTNPDFGDVDPGDPAIPVNTDEPAPDTDRCPSSGLEDLQRQPVPVTEASGVQLVRRRTRKDGPRPPKPCAVCARPFSARSATQVCCDRQCGGVYRSQKRLAAEEARAARAGVAWPHRDVGT